MPFNFRNFNNSNIPRQNTTGAMYGAVGGNQMGYQQMANGNRTPMQRQMQQQMSNAWQNQTSQQAIGRNQAPMQRQMSNAWQNQVLQQAQMALKQQMPQQAPPPQQNQALQQAMGRNQMAGQKRQPQQARQNQAGMRNGRANTPQMPQQMPKQPFMHNQQPSQQAPNMPPAGQTTSSQASQFTQAPPNGIPINEENINHLIKTLNESDAKKNQVANPSLMNMNPSVEAPQNMQPESITGIPQSASGVDWTDKLAQHIQNETNGVAFYAHLARNAPTSHTRQNFEDIIGRCNARAKAYGEIYRGKSGKQFEAKNVVINNQVSFKDGVQLAINEEKKSITDLFAFYENLTDNQVEKAISCQIFRKLCDLNVLLDTKFSQ